MSPSETSRIVVAELMARWPRTVLVFNARRMACPGCVMAPFVTVAEAAASYQFDVDDLAGELCAAALSSGSAAVTWEKSADDT